MESIELKYGEGYVSIPIEGASSLEVLREREMPVIEELPTAFLHAVEEGAIGHRLRDAVQAGDRVTIIISDITRFWMRQDLICELLVRYLEEMGVRDEDIAILVALGTHRAQTEEELCRLASSYVYERVRVCNHDCDASDLIEVGTTTRGTRVAVNALAVGRKVIVIGGTVHHLMAGYGGGRKSILPGIASRETIRQNHGHALDPSAPRSSLQVGSGKLSLNPIHEDMDEAARMVAPAFGINIVVNSASRHSGLFCGDFDAAWRASCDFCQSYYGLPIDGEADIVIASCGGFPKDLNLYQGVKALLNGVRALKKGGTFLFLAECREGGGAPDFFDWTGPLSRGTLDGDLRAAFTIAGYIFYASCESIAKAGHFYMLSDLSPTSVAPMKIEASNDLEALLAKIDFAGKKVYVLPNGGAVVPQRAEEYKAFCAEFR